MQPPDFHFTITDVARFLGKSPVTLRGWERQGLITFPREGSDRKLSCEEIIEVADKVQKLGRITPWRQRLIVMAITTLQTIQKENQRKKR